MLLTAAVLTSCGGDSATEPKAPRIPAAVAERLAGLSDETAAALEVGDGCAAREAAEELKREALKAESEIPAELRPEVTDGVQQLTTAIECEPAPVVETVPETTTDESFCPPGQLKREDGHKGDEDGHGDEGHGKDEEAEKEREEREKEREKRLKELCEEAKHGAEEVSHGEGEGD